MYRGVAARAGRLATVVMVSLGMWGCSTNPDVAKAEYLKSGNAYFEQGKLPEAVVEYRNALAQDANVLVFPDLQSGNLALHALQYMGEAVPVGPDRLHAADRLFVLRWVSDRRGTLVQVRTDLAERGLLRRSLPGRQTAREEELSWQKRTRSTKRARSAKESRVVSGR